MNFLYWNVRGIGNFDPKIALQNLNSKVLRNLWISFEIE